MTTLILGRNTNLQYTNADVYRYSFSGESDSRTISETDYLTPHQSKISYDHLAEISAFYTIAKHNPLGFKDSDLVQFLSGEMFSNTTERELYQVVEDEIVSEMAEKYLLTRDDIMYHYAFIRRNIMGYREPEGTFDSHLNMDVWKQCGLHIRSRYDNMPNVFRNYIILRYDALVQYVDWIWSNLFSIFWDKDWNQRSDHINQLSDCAVRENSAYRDRFRVFGIVVEFMGHRYFANELMHRNQYVLYRDWVAQIEYDAELNPTIEILA